MKPLLPKLSPCYRNFLVYFMYTGHHSKLLKENVAGKKGDGQIPSSFPHSASGTVMHSF